MKLTWRLGPIFGVRIRIHAIALAAFALLAVPIRTIGAPGEPPLSAGLGWVLGVAASALIVVSVGAHELAHVLAARRLGLPIDEVGLLALGDRTQADHEAADGAGEILISASGVVLSLLVGAVLLLAWYVVASAPSETTALFRGVLWWTAAGNLVLGAINLVPGYPLDGGRLVRGVLWWSTGDRTRATVVAGKVARAFAWALIFGGLLWAFVAVDLFFGLWLAVGGVFLMRSSSFFARRMEIRRVVAGLTVRDVMDEEVAVVGPNLTLDTLYDQYERSREVESFPVTSDGRLLGSIDVKQILSVPRGQWARTRVTDVMTELGRLQTTTGREPVLDALLRFDRTRLDAIPVVDEEGKHLVGILTRERLLEKLRPRVRRLAEQDQAVESGP